MTKAGSCCQVVILYGSTFIVPSICYGYNDTHRLSQGPQRFMVHFLQEEAVLAASPGNKRTRIGFVWLFTHMMDCDEATLSVREGRRWPAVLLCWALLWWMIPPHFSLVLSQMLDNPGDLRRSLVDCLTGWPQPRLCFACARYQQKYSCQTMQKASSLTIVSP